MAKSDRDLLAEDAVVMAQGLEQVWRRAAQDWHIGCSFGVMGNEGRTMLWSGTRPGDTMADLIFCLAFLRLQMILEERFRAQGHFWWTARGGMYVALQSHVHGRLGGLGERGTRQNRCWPNFRVHSRP